MDIKMSFGTTYSDIKYISVGGISCSGKTTLSNYVEKELKCLRFCPYSNFYDDVMTDRILNMGVVDSSCFRYARLLKVSIKRSIEKNRFVVIDHSFWEPHLISHTPLLHKTLGIDEILKQGVHYYIDVDFTTYRSRKKERDDIDLCDSGNKREYKHWREKSIELSKTHSNIIMLDGSLSTEELFELIVESMRN